MDNQSTNNQSPKKKTSLIIAIVIAVIILIGGAVAAYFMIVNNDQKSNAGVKKQESSKISSACLTYDEANEIAKYSSKSDFKPSALIASETYFFNADSATLRDDNSDIHTESLDKLAAWIKKYENKSFKVTIAGQVNSKSVGETATKLANDRARTIYDQLVKRGVKSDKLEIGQPISADGAGSDDQEAYRNVSASIYGSEACAE